VYWYNGVMISSEISRGLDIFELVPSGFISQNEIDAAKSVKLDYLNTQGQPQYVWPKTYSLARAYLDQLERSKGMEAEEIAFLRKALADAERAPAAEQRATLEQVAARLESVAGDATDAAKVRTLAQTVRGLAGETSLASVK
jgi:hypothetical protein